MGIWIMFRMRYVYPDLKDRWYKVRLYTGTKPLRVKENRKGQDTGTHRYASWEDCAEFNF